MVIQAPTLTIKSVDNVKITARNYVIYQLRIGPSELPAARKCQSLRLTVTLFTVTIRFGYSLSNDQYHSVAALRNAFWSPDAQALAPYIHTLEQANKGLQIGHPALWYRHEL